MSALDTLAGMLQPSKDNAPRFDTGTVVALQDAQHISVDMGDHTVTAMVPSTLVGGCMLGSYVRVAVQGNTVVLDSILRGAWIGKVEMSLDGSARPGWLVLDGSTFSAVTYPLLAAFLGTTTLPDARDRFPVGASTTRAVKSVGGSALIAEGELPTHTHDVWEAAESSEYGLYANTSNGTASFKRGDMDVAVASATAGNDEEYWPRYIAVVLLVKAI